MPNMTQVRSTAVTAKNAKKRRSMRSLPDVRSELEIQEGRVVAEIDDRGEEGRAEAGGSPADPQRPGTGLTTQAEQRLGQRVRARQEQGEQQRHQDDRQGAQP